MHGSDADKPAIWLIGDLEQRDFSDAIALLKSTASIGRGEPELVVVAQSRPGTIRHLELNLLRRSAPLAGVVSLLGSWCEGESRTGRPLADTNRLYWYEFPNWWRRQLHLRRQGLCPEWAGNPHPQQRSMLVNRVGANVAIAASNSDTVAAIGDAVRAATGHCCWWRENQRIDVNCDFDAGVWVGGQLSDVEAARLADFCATMAQHDAPVVALLDFPRRDRLDVARNAGAAAVLGAPWRNDDLVDELQRAIRDAKSPNPIHATRAA